MMDEETLYHQDQAVPPEPPDSLASAEEQLPEREIAEEVYSEPVESGQEVSEPETADEGISTSNTPVWLDKLDDLASQQLRLSDMFDDKLRYDASREAMIDKLHSEIQDYRNDMLGKVMLPVLKDLISLDNEVIKFVKDRGDIEKFPPERQNWNELLQQIAMFHDDIVEILDRYGIVAFEEESDTFNPRTQRSLNTRPTEAQDRNRIIAERIRPGFRWGDQVVRHEEVIVYKYQAPQPEPPVAE